ncbi:14-3-3 protein zeta/delta-like [Saccoglossus kowalevskii]|uniref:14-3-3 protein zeta/delta-like n=1 Tax=Saccoglossus kowalevskii TaxID=10224 RepID=A0ABM0GII1_SACKO|nr:PREDICTED: 14-3-3 protein zeta/delta-like [Saccoglossus kowalevskii]
MFLLKNLNLYNLEEKMKNRDALVTNARWAEQAERYDDMTLFMKFVAECDGSMTEDERNLFSVAFKNVVGAKRSSWRSISSLETKTGRARNDMPQTKPTRERRIALCREYREKIEIELGETCDQVLTLIAKHLDRTEDPCVKVFYLKMKGDYHRYLAEVRSDSDRKCKDAIEAEQAYQQALEISTDSLCPTHPVRLGLALNYSVFHYEISNAQHKACSLAQEAFDKAVSELGPLTEDSQKDSVLILQLLKDNLTLWASDPEEVLLDDFEESD